MRATWPTLLPLLAGLALGGIARAAAPAQEIVFVAPTNLTMPLARFESEQLSGGILKDLGEAIAQRLGLQPRFVTQPSKRVGPALQQGKADGVCYVLPHWLEGSYNWSVPVIPNAGLVVAHGDAPAARAVADFADKPLGTVLGYRYPQFEQPLGSHFVRDDAPTMEANLRKLAAGRIKYAIIEQNTLAYFLRSNPGVPLKGILQVAHYTTQCAFSRESKLPFAEVNKAIGGLVTDGSVERILTRYR